LSTLENAKATVKNAEYLTEKQKDKILNQFLTELRMSENISSQHTFAKHLQKIRNILKHNQDKNLVKLENYNEQLSKKIRSQIQNSEYKVNTDKYSEYSWRNKKDHWVTWKYWTKHVMQRTQELPHAYFDTLNENQVDTQAGTKPQDLPTPSQMRKLLRTLPQASKDKTALRNQAVFTLIWSIGTRRGETFPIQMKDIDVTDKRVRIYIHGTKSSGDDWVRVYQGEQLLRKYIQQHPEKNNPDAYLFPKTYYNQYEQKIDPNSVKKKMLQARASANLDFKTYGEPFHIFRKAMTTFHVLNDILDWEGICKKQRKKPDSTKPDYLLQAMQDIEKKEAEAYGIEDQVREGRMIGQPLMPQECMECGRKNTCIAENCVECSGDLQQNEMPKNMDEGEADGIGSERINELQEELDSLKEEMS